MRFIVALIASAIGFSAMAHPSNSNPSSPNPSVNAQTLISQKAYLQTIDCRAPQQISQLVSAALKDADNYSAKASKASVLEEIMLKNPPCMIQALNQLPAKACLQFKENFIEETFFYPRDEIKSALATAKHYNKSCVAG